MRLSSSPLQAVVRAAVMRAAPTCIALFVLMLATAPSATLAAVLAPQGVASSESVPTEEGGPSLRPTKKAVRTIWRINDGDKISDSFRAWAMQSRQWQVAWEAPELVAQAGVDLDGSFEDAVTKVIEALNRGDANLLARFYVEGNSKILRVMENR